jgi:hypothetical protein
MEKAGVLTCIVGEVQGSFAGHPAERAYLLNIHQQPKVDEVTCNGTLLPALGTRQSIAQAPSGWWWDATKRLLTVTLRQPAKTVTIEIK